MTIDVIDPRMKDEEHHARVFQRGPWSKEEQKDHINMLELKTVKMGLLSFTKFRKAQRVHLHKDNQVTLTYLLKMGSTYNNLTFRYG